MAKRKARASFHGFTSAEVRRINAANTPTEWKKAFDDASDARARRHALMGGHRPVGLPALKENPISTTQWAIGGVVVLGIAGAIYYFTTTSSTTSSGSGGGSPSPTPGTVQLIDGEQAVSVPATGITITLPPGATWLTVGKVGLSTPMFLPGNVFATGTGTFPVTWMLKGVTHTTDLTLTVGT